MYDYRVRNVVITGQLNVLNTAILFIFRTAECTFPTAERTFAIAERRNRSAEYKPKACSYLFKYVIIKYL